MIGQTISHYRVLSEVGKGGMGVDVRSRGHPVGAASCSKISAAGAGQRSGGTEEFGKLRSEAAECQKRVQALLKSTETPTYHRTFSVNDTAFVDAAEAVTVIEPGVCGVV
jgi:hypothetical protein